MAPAGRACADAAAWYSVQRASIACFSSLASRPVSRLPSGLALPMACIQEATTLFFRPRYRSRTDCASRGEAAPASSVSKARTCDATESESGRLIERGQLITKSRRARKDFFLRGFVASCQSGNDQARAGVFAAALACCASVANADGLAMAS